MILKPFPPTPQGEPFPCWPKRMIKVLLLGLPTNKRDCAIIGASTILHSLKRIALIGA
jgi:hypothetical protein